VKQQLKGIGVYLDIRF